MSETPYPKIVERAARALLAARYGPVTDAIWREKWARIDGTDPYLPRQARAALEEIRVPTDAMISAGHAAMEDWRLGPSDPDVIWRAMIDIFLSPGEDNGRQNPGDDDQLPRK